MKETHRHFWHRTTLHALAVASSALLFSSTAAAQAAANPPPPEDWFTYYFFDNYGFTLLFVIGIVGLLVYRKRKAKSSAKTARVVPQPAEQRGAESRRPAQNSTRRESDQQQPQSPIPETAPQDQSQAFGAYRIDQEVGKLVLGKTHRLDVLASRVPDDRRAIEASLVKSLNGGDTEADGRERARRALEDYGFVARQSALVLQGRDAWERSSAARVLGQFGSPASLPALIEALHDHDSIVRNQAVTSLGQLKHPAAIGALLDVARRYSDIPASILSESLSACSVDGLGFLDSAPFDFNEDSTGSEHDLQSFSSRQELPAGDDDDAVQGLLTRLETPDTAERAQVARELGSHESQKSVAALTAVALRDENASVRAAAVGALGSIDHQSVFAPVLIALADETREVRAAAARTLSGLHFDRAQAYARLMEGADEEILSQFAQACVKTGIFAQAVDRLSSEDRRQAHEAFSVFSVLAKAGELQPIFDVIQNHGETRVRLEAVRTLNHAGPDALPKLREIVAMPNLAEDLRTSILELLYKVDNEPAVVTTVE
jgi:HEAT repeat protein